MTDIVLAIAAHPDDVEAFAGGTLAALAQRGVEVHTCIVTGGEAGVRGMSADAAAALRHAEAKAASEVLGARSFTALGQRDGRVEATLELREEVIALARRVGATLLLTHPTDDYHPDHRAVGAGVADARLLCDVPNVGDGTPLAANPTLAYWDPQGGVPGRADIRLDVSATIGVRRRALACHASQATLPDGRSLAAVTESLARDRGAQRGCEFAEAFRGTDTVPDPDGAVRRLVVLLEGSRSHFRSELD